MPKNLQQLPKVRDSLSYLYVEHCSIEQDMQSVAMINKEGKTPIPVASLTLLMLGPGTKVTHAAIKTLCDNGCMAVWCGEGGTRFYASGIGETRSAANLIHQARLSVSPELCLVVAKRLYQIRFKYELDSALTLQQIRGKEGIRVREAYRTISAETGVIWKGRNYDTNTWENSDTINRALSMANACLYGLCHAAIISLGYSPGLGFIHVGKQLSFVYDIADLYKTETSIPAAFHVTAQNPTKLGSEIRKTCRHIFHQNKLLKRIPEDISYALDVKQSYDEDINAISPGHLWDNQEGLVEGGINYAEEGDTDYS